MKIKFLLFLIFLLLLNFSCGVFLRRGPEYELRKQEKLTNLAVLNIKTLIESNKTPGYAGPIPQPTTLDSLKLNRAEKKMEIYLSKKFSFQPFRTESVQKIYDLFKSALHKEFTDYRLQIFSLGYPIEQLIPNLYRPEKKYYDKWRLTQPSGSQRIPVIVNLNKVSWLPKKGLFNKNLVISHSHGWFYSNHKNRWEWQRPRLFSRVEDLLPFSITVPYLIPMLENAGATVFTPRERDIQTNEVIVDNDSQSSRNRYFESDSSRWFTGFEPGFGEGSPPYFGDVNPFLQGTFRYCYSDTVTQTVVEWAPDIPETGEYAVYISWQSMPGSTQNARYRVYHTGGISEFSVNQQIGGKSWFYLGKFKFRAGINPGVGKVVLLNRTNYAGEIITADAVRFGGGMGSIVRGDGISGYPRYAESGRYYLQYAGLPDTLVYSHTENKNDYQDDFMSRSEYANYLKGAPFGPNKKRDEKGLQIPIDAYLSLHTDAGIADDSTIGTLMIYRIESDDTLSVFPDQVSRLANRDFSDILQTEIVTMIRAKYDSGWTRRGLMEANYSEARRPNMPGCLLELLSHQNFTDMKYATDPRFRFDAARAIYKGILKFLATQNGTDYTVAPLPVTHFRSYFSGPAEITLQWRPQADPLEPSANPRQFVVYTREDSGGFDSGRLVSDTTFVLSNIKPGIIYGFKITAVNAGGESFPSEILSVCWQNEFLPPVLVINGFDRICGPSFVDEPHFKGFTHFLDAGVPDKFDYGFTGEQFDYYPDSKFRTNDGPGHGTSYATLESQIIAGNSFDYPYLHGQAIRACALSFISCSNEAFIEQLLGGNQYRMIDLILGEEKQTLPVGKNWFDEDLKPDDIQYEAFSAQLILAINRYLRQGGRLFVSGANPGTSLMFRADLADSLFARDWLKFVWQTDHASKSGYVYPVDTLFLPSTNSMEFNTRPNPNIYIVESPDAIEPASEAKILMRYRENRFGAMVGHQGRFSVVVAGFPFETVLGEKNRIELMQAIISFLSKKR